MNILIYISICVIALSACDKRDEQTMPYNLTEESNVNPFFLENKVNSLTYRGRFLSEDESIIEEDVKIKVERIEQLKSGVIYKFKISPVKGVPEERLFLGMFLVQKDKIYKLQYTGDNAESIRKWEKNPTESNIICQEEEIKDKVKENEKGFHQYLSVQGDLRKYHSYNDKVETGFFETYIWERNIGLKYYKSGYGAENNLVELTAKDIGDCLFNADKMESIEISGKDVCKGKEVDISTEITAGKKAELVIKRDKNRPSFSMIIYAGDKGIDMISNLAKSLDEWCWVKEHFYYQMAAYDFNHDGEKEIIVAGGNKKDTLELYVFRLNPDLDFEKNEPHLLAEINGGYKSYVNEKDEICVIDSNKDISVYSYKGGKNSATKEEIIYAKTKR